MANLPNSPRAFALGFGPDTLAEARNAATASPSNRIEIDGSSFRRRRSQLAAHLAQPADRNEEVDPVSSSLTASRPRPVEASTRWRVFRSSLTIATEHGWAALAYASRGIGESEGDFSLAGWLRDLNGDPTSSSSVEIDGPYLIGFGTGGALAIEAGAADPHIRGVAAVQRRPTSRLGAIPASCSFSPTR